MIDPTGLLKDKTRYEQEVTVLYIITVAGKTSEYAVNALGRFLAHTEYLGVLPFDRILELWRTDSLEAMLRECRLSPYGMRTKAFRHAATFNKRHDLRKVTPDEWANVGGERVGIGPKTARYILMCLDPDNARVAALDTHVLKWLKHLGYPNVPKSTPPAGPAYNEWEEVFLLECDKRGRIPADLDLEVWSAYKYGKEIPS